MKINRVIPGIMIYPIRPLNNWGLASVSRMSRELFGPEKPFVKLRPAYFVKLVFSYVVKGIKIKITAKFRASRRLRFEDTKRIMSPEKFRDFRETGARLVRFISVISSCTVWPYCNISIDCTGQIIM